MSFIVVDGVITYVHKIGKKVVTSIPYDEVTHFASDSKYIAVNTRNSLIFVEDTLKKIMLRHDDLIQISRSKVVKKSCVFGVLHDPLQDKHLVILKDNSKHSISRRNRKSVYYWWNSRNEE